MIRSEIIVNHVEGPNVLDVGCAGHEVVPESPYWLHGKLTEKFPETVGLDYSAENIIKMRGLGYQNLFIGNAENFNLDEKFDTIVAGELIEHLSNPGNFLQTCAKHLSPSGKLIITTPYVFSLLYILYSMRKFPKTCQNDEHAVWFCVSTLQEISRRNGFRIEHWELIQDYHFDDPSLPYRIFARFITSIGKIVLPKYLTHNVMLFILRLDK